MAAGEDSRGSHAYRPATAAALGSALGAGLLVALGDVALALRSGSGWGAGIALRFAAIVVPLYCGAALVAGLLEGLVAGAVRASHPGGVDAAWRRLRDDPAADRSAVAVLLAGCAVAVLFAGAVAVLALRLVAAAMRKAVGALLLGGAAAVLAPVLALLGWPAYRVTRRLAPLVPRLGPVPATVTLTLVLAAAASAAGGLYVVTRLDWRVLPLGPPLAALSFLVLQGLLLALWYGPLRGGLRRRFPARSRRATLAAAAALALATPVLVSALITPGPAVANLLTVHGAGSRVLVALVRRAADRDGDGYSALLGGGDCDDRNPAVHPGAVDEPGNGIDENCLGGDAAPAAPAPRAPAPPPDSKTARFRFAGNVLVIVVDTLRADRLGAAGYTRDGRSLTPRMDELARQGVWFRRAYAQAPHTPRSFPSLFLSRYPSQIRWDRSFQNYPNVRPGDATVWQALRDAGLRTLGFSSHFYFTEKRGILAGFDEYDNTGATNLKDSNHDVSAPRITPRVVARLGALGKSGERFALFVHFNEPHSTYVEHPEFPITARGTEALEQKYDYEIAYVDRFVGEILDALDAAGLADRTLVVLVSDHAEAFGAHRFAGQRLFFHGQSLYDELLLVPLVFRVPGVAPRTVEQPVELIDVAPTILDAIKAPAPPGFRGRSLLPAFFGEPLAARPVHAELLPYPNWDHSSKMMIDADGRTKIIYRISDNLFELYDLAEDPQEQRNLVGARRDAARDMQEKIARWIESQLPR